MKLTVNDLSYSYTKDVPVLKGVSFTADKGEFLSVLGPNGAGKSTLFRCLLGGIDGYSGAIDLVNPINVVTRANGEKIIMVEENGAGKVMVYRWTPPHMP